MPQTIDNMSVTWTNSLTTYTGIKLNATDTASAAGSLLMDLQVGGASRFKVDKNGALTIRSFNGVGTLTLLYNSNTPALNLNAGLCVNTNTANVLFGTNADVVLSRRAAYNLRLGAADAAAPVAQTLSVQSVVAGTTNTAGANLTITGSQGTGTGAGGSIVFQVAPAGSSGTAQNALADMLTITQSNVRVHGFLMVDSYLNIGGTQRYGWSARAALSSPADSIITLVNNGNNNFDRLQFGGTTSSFPALKRSSTTLQARLADDSGFASVQGKLTTDTAYTAGAPTATGYLVLFDSNGTAYRVPAVLN